MRHTSGAGRTVAAAAAANQLHIATGRHLPGQSSLAAAAPLSGAHITIPPLASAVRACAFVALITHGYDYSAASLC